MEESSLKEEALIKETEIKQVCTFNPHKDVIRSIQFINSTDRPLIMTASLDRFVHIHSIDLVNTDDIVQRLHGMVSSFSLAHPAFRTCNTKGPCCKGICLKPLTSGILT